MSSPLVTIAIPAYKADFLKEAISSALNQTYSNIELVVVDDCSPEGISGIVNGFDDSRIRYFRNEINIGTKDPSLNWNRCLEYARGDFFALLCDDDIYEPTFVEKMLELRQKYQDVKVFRARAQTINENGQITNWYPSAPTFETCFDYMYQRLSGYRLQTISEFFYDTEYIKGLGGFSNTPRAWAADALSVFKLAWENGIASTQNFLVSFRGSKKNISSVKSDSLEKRDALFIFKKEINGFLQQLDNPTHKKLLENALYYFMYVELVGLCARASLCNILRIVFKGGFPKRWIIFIVVQKISSLGNR